MSENATPPVLLPNGNPFVPARKDRRLDPLSPAAAFTPMQHQRVLDLLEEATRPLWAFIEVLAKKAGVEMPERKPAARVLIGKAHLAKPEKEREPKIKERTRKKADANPAAGTAGKPAEETKPPAELSPKLKAVLARANSPALKKQVRAILEADAPDDVKVARAMAMINKQNAVGLDTVAEE